MGPCQTSNYAGGSMLNQSNAHLLLPRVRLIFILASLTSAFAVPLALAQGKPAKFVAAPTVVRGSTGSSAYKAFAGRFSRNGRLDVVFSGVTNNSPVSTNFSETAVNQGGGTFTTVNNNGGRFNDGLTGPDLGADLNGDGITDAITVVYNQLQIQLGAEDGTFGDPSFITLDGGATPNAFAAGDFDGNGTMDLAVLTSNDTLVILLNDGEANFHTAFTYQLSAGAGRGGLVVGDINGDTLADVVLFGEGTVTPYLSTHGGALTRGTTYATAGSPAAIVDVNHDGFGDIAIVSANGVQFMLGSSSGQLKAGKSVPVSGLAGLTAIAFADFNDDGAIDLAIAGTLPVSGQSPSFVNVYLGNNSGTFGAPTVYSTGNVPVSLMAGDFYGSGKIDLMTFNAGDAGLSLFQNIGGGHFQAATVTHSSNATGIVAGDFNRDGKQDVAVVNTPNCKSPCKGTVTVFPGTGLNYFNPGKTYPIGMHGAAIATGDLNHDGILDLVVVNSIAGDAADTSVLLGNADGTFQPARNYTLGSLSNDVVLIDINKDGKLDLVTAGGVALGKGDGTFAPRKPFPGFGFGPTLHFAVADVNGDGKLDVVLVDSGNFPGCGNEFQVLLGDGKGGFSTGQNIFNEQGEPVTSIALARMRVGGAYDILYSFVGGCNGQVGGETFSGVAGYIGDGHGTGTFTNTFSAVIGELFSDVIAYGPVVVADFNGDGKPDIGVGTIGHFAVALGNGDETFQPQQLFTADNFQDSTTGTTTVVPSGIVVADFLKDGKMDVALTSGLGVARLYNATP
jgi:FG-GAP-like repeat